MASIARRVVQRFLAAASKEEEQERTQEKRDVFRKFQRQEASVVKRWGQWLQRFTGKPWGGECDAYPDRVEIKLMPDDGSGGFDWLGERVSLNLSEWKTHEGAIVVFWQCDVRYKNPQGDYQDDTLYNIDPSEVLGPKPGKVSAALKGFLKV